MREQGENSLESRRSLPSKSSFRLPFLTLSYHTHCSFLLLTFCACFNTLPVPFIVCPLLIHYSLFLVLTVVIRNYRTLSTYTLLYPSSLTFHSFLFSLVLMDIHVPIPFDVSIVTLVILNILLQAHFTEELKDKIDLFLETKQKF